jgi:hypothetical protein
LVLSCCHGDDAGDLGYADEVRDGVDTHLFHDATAVDFDRLFRGSEIGGNLFVEEAGNDAFQDFEFARSESVQPRTSGGMFGSSLAHFEGAMEGSLDRAEQLFVFDGLGEEIDGAGFHRRDTHGYVAMAGEKDDLSGAIGEGLLEFQAAVPRHLHIEDETHGAIVRNALEIVRRGVECFRFQTDGTEEPGEAASYGIIIVDDADQGVFWRLESERLRAHKISGTALILLSGGARVKLRVDVAAALDIGLWSYGWNGAQTACFDRYSTQSAV